MTMTAPEEARAVAPSADFTSLGVPAPLVASLNDRGITAPFPIQAATLHDSLNGRDVIGRGRTGSGKTVAFAVPTVVAAARRRRTPRQPHGLVLVPTRELAAQVAETLVPLADALQLKVTVIHGGVGFAHQIKAFTQGVDIVVACPGRLEDLIAQGHCRLDAVSITVLDEADHMADLGFLPAVKRLLDQTPGDGQRLLFSATIDQGIDVLVKRYLHNPVTHSVDGAESPVPAMTHHVVMAPLADKPEVVRALAAGEGRRLLFTRTKHGAKKLAAQLTKVGIPSVELHGNLSQNARTHNLELFASGRARVLVATDIAARGIHVDDIELVVHVDPPAEHKAYLHRSGRTARAGAEGVVVTVATPEQRRDVDTLMRQAKLKPTVTSVKPGHPVLVDLAGPAAPADHRPLPLREAPAPTPRQPKASQGTKGAPRRSGRPGGRPGGPSTRGRGQQRSR
jgi:superfamily II DNA/RNA helicase